jgi:hypothetical protein
MDSLTIPVCISENLKRARDAISQLSEEEKALLLQEMLGNSTQVFPYERDFVTASVGVQIQSSNVNLSEVFRAAAWRVSREKPI